LERWGEKEGIGEPSTGRELHKEKNGKMHSFANQESKFTGLIDIGFMG
jgi:hypothetical protein